MANSNLQVVKGAVLLNKEEVEARDWLVYLKANMKELIADLHDATILILAGRHGQETGAIGDVEYLEVKGEKLNIVMYNHERLVSFSNSTNIFLKMYIPDFPNFRLNK